MSTDLGKKFNINWLGVPPHMSKEDYEIWIRYRDRALIKAVAVYYDVGLGAGRVPLAVNEPGMLAMWKKLNQKRADVIIEYQNEIKIIELRHNARLDTIGRLTGYGILYNEAPILRKTPKFVIVTNLYDEDVERTAKTLGMEYVVV